jgi:hypothetical protein
MHNGETDPTLILFSDETWYNLARYIPSQSDTGVTYYKACPDSKDTKGLNMNNIFNLQKPHCQSIACT